MECNKHYLVSGVLTRRDPDWVPRSLDITYEVVLDSFDLLDSAGQPDTASRDTVVIRSGFDWLSGIYDSTRTAGKWLNLRYGEGVEGRPRAIDTLDKGTFTGATRAGKKDGRWTLRYADGRPKEDGVYIRELRDGRWMHWHANGRKLRESYFRLGKEVGCWTLWSDSGHKTSETSYNRNRSVVTTECFPRGGASTVVYKSSRAHFPEIERTAEWYENGASKSLSELQAGRSCGTRREWFDNGRLKSMVRYGEPDCIVSSRTWYENGKPRVVDLFARGDGCGPHVEFHENGRPKEKGQYEHRSQEGEWTKFYDNGGLKQIAHCARGMLDGECLGYDSLEGGKLRSFAVYHQGKMVYREDRDGKLRHGRYQEFFDNGSPRVDGYFRSGARDSVWTFWSPDGSVDRRLTYSAGIVHL